MRGLKILETVNRLGPVRLTDIQAATGLPFVVKAAEEPMDKKRAVIKSSGQERGEQARARRKEAAKARRKRNMEKAS